MKLSRPLADLADRLGHGFTRPELLIEALTHPSKASGLDNQRLEFLGDRVLGLVIAEALLAQDPAATEGQLAPRRLMPLMYCERQLASQSANAPMRRSASVPAST